eukprot:5139719-Prymnesium_polylepis.1
MSGAAHMGDAAAGGGEAIDGAAAAASAAAADPLERAPLFSSGSNRSRGLPAVLRRPSAGGSQKGPRLAASLYKPLLADTFSAWRPSVPSPPGGASGDASAAAGAADGELCAAAFLADEP